PPGATVYVFRSTMMDALAAPVGHSGEVLSIDPRESYPFNWRGLLYIDPADAQKGVVPTFKVEFRKPGFQNLDYIVETYRLMRQGGEVVKIPEEGVLDLKWEPSVVNLPNLTETRQGRVLLWAVTFALLAGLFALNRELRRRRIHLQHSSLLSQVLPSPDADPLIQKPFGEYFVAERLGQGGMASVYRVVRTSDPGGEARALKVMHPQVAQHPDFVRRFKREIDVSSRLVHPNIVRMLDSGIEQGRYYILMELVEGRTLRALNTDGHLLDYTLETVTAIGAALTYAHAQGVIHRDLKPENIMVGSRGEVKVMDFGLARTFDATALTASGSIMGTPAYMAPEQINEAELTAATDQYALGCLIFEMLTGRAPYLSDNPNTLLMKHCNAPIPSLLDWRRDVPHTVDDVVRRMLEKNPPDRFPDIASALAALQEAARV
ncbi:MAG: serine/threonine-protein kinase, partial [Candidatus Xenobia bacterium]